MWKKRVGEFDDRIQRTFNTTTTSISINLTVIQQGKLLSLEDEDEQFIQDYSRVIDSEHVKHIDDLHIGADNNYIGMELGIRCNEDGPWSMPSSKDKKHI